LIDVVLGLMEFRTSLGTIPAMTQSNAKSPDSAKQRPQTQSDAAAVKKSQRLFIWVALIVLLIDQLSKYWIEITMPLNTSSVPFEALYPYFQLTHVANTGAAFGILKGASFIFTILAVIVSFAIAFYNFKLKGDSVLLRVALGLLFGGAVGNLLSRLRIGHVTDFLNFDVSSIINFPYADWPVFNVADMALIAGIIILGYIMIKEPELVEA
jgi:signal peptidase II